MLPDNLAGEGILLQIKGEFYPRNTIKMSSSWCKCRPLNPHIDQYFQDFLGEVTSVGLQTQYEAVCENLGLIAYLVQVLIFVINAVIIVTVNDIDKNLTLEKRVSTRRIEVSFLFLFSIYEIVNKKISCSSHF